MSRRAEAKRGAQPPVSGSGARPWGWADLASGIGLSVLTVYFLAVSWRKWPDPLIDFGRELYTPWRLAEGAVLFRDVDSFYGPFSQCFNGLVFAVFGPGLMTLVAVNLAIFAGILTLLYASLRVAWGKLAAFFGSAVFVAVFGFSQHVDVGNYNYAAPYAHETTHGVLVSLLLVAVLVRWLERPDVSTSVSAGLLCGLTAVLKPEFMLAAGIVMLAALLLHGWRHGAPKRSVWIAWFVGAVLPSLGFFAYFLSHLSPGEAFAATSNAWLSVTDGAHTGDVIQSSFLGADRPGANLALHLKATLFALIVIAVPAGTALLGERLASSRWRYGLAALVAVALAAFSHFQIPWSDVGRCLLGLVLLYVLAKVASVYRLRRQIADWRSESARLLLALLAAGLMARMALNGRIFQYGYYQAALAAVLIPAVLVGEVSGWLRLQRNRVVGVAGALALLVPGVILLVRHSNGILRLKTAEIGKGGDRFHGLPTNLDASGQLVRLGIDFLGQQPPGQTLVVLPEGIMINYLARRVSPVSTFAFYGAATAGEREAKLVEKLRRNPPDWVMIVSRDLREYGIERYGEKSGSGQELVRWLQEDYQRVAKVGGDPLDRRDRGAQIFAPKAAVSR
jgi:hypothetical protein